MDFLGALPRFFFFAPFRVLGFGGLVRETMGIIWDGERRAAEKLASCFPRAIFRQKLFAVESK